VHRIAVRVAQLFVTVVVGLAILGSLVVWRLSQGPVSLDFITPSIERAFAANELPVAIQVENTTLVWGGWGRVFDLRAVNVRLFGGDGKIVALLPEVSIGLSMKGLMRGDVAISRLDVFGLRTLIKRHPDGRLDVAMPVEPKGGENAEGAFAGVASELLKSVREGQGVFRYLRRFSILSAKAQYVDEKNRQLWLVPAADMITVFGPEVIESQFRMMVENAGDRTQIAATLLHDRKSARIGGRVDFNALEPTLITRALPHLYQLAGIRLPFSGSAHFEVASNWRLLGMRLQLASPVGRAIIGMQYPPAGDRVHVLARLENVHLAGLARATPDMASLAGLDIPISGQIEGDAVSANAFQVTRVDLKGGSGAIELPGILPRRVGVAGVQLHAELSDNQSKIAVTGFKLDLDGPSLSATATAERDGEGYRVRTEGTVAAVRMAALDNYWPLNLGPVARRWVIANIVDGTVDNGTFAAVASVPITGDGRMHLDEISGTLDYRGLSVDYLAPMSKVTAIAGKANFDKTHFDLLVSEGKLRDLDIDRAVINMSALDTDNERIAIDVSFKGPARTLAEVLDEQPLGFLGALSLAPTAISGKADARTKFHFPLHRNLTASQVKFDATGTLEALTVSPAPHSLDVRDGKLKLKVDNVELSATGAVTLSGLRADVDWRERFAKDAKQRRRLVFSGRIPDMAKPGFGLPDLDFLAGASDANVAFTQQRNGDAELLINLELADTMVDLPALGWKKMAGSAGTANATLTLDKDGLKAVDRLSIETGPSRLLAAVQSFGPERKAWLATVERFRSGGNDLQGKIERRPDGGIRADLAGKRFDVAGVVDLHAARSDAAADEGGALPTIDIHARVGDLRWGEARRVRDSSVTVKYVDDRIEGLTVDGRIGGDGKLAIRYLPGPDGQVLRISADDFGAILAMSPSRSKVNGGALVIRGLQRKPGVPLEGDFYASNFTLSQAPLLARVLQVASLAGIVDALSHEGLTFEAFEGKYAYQDGRITFGKASAYGSSIGLSGSGVLDLVKDTADASGTVVPAYSLNRVLGKIPVIGSLLTGGENEGIFAATYRVQGPIDHPKVEVNPLSALAPGFLRNLFGLGAAKEPALPPAQ